MMEQTASTEIVPYLVGALGGLVMILITLVSWIGANILSKQDRLDEKVSEHYYKTTERLTRIESEVKDIERRVNKLEAA